MIFNFHQMSMNSESTTYNWNYTIVLSWNCIRYFDNKTLYGKHYRCWSYCETIKIALLPGRIMILLGQWGNDELMNSFFVSEICVTKVTTWQTVHYRSPELCFDIMKAVFPLWPLWFSLLCCQFSLNLPKPDSGFPLTFPLNFFFIFP